MTAHDKAKDSVQQRWSRGHKTRGQGQGQRPPLPKLSRGQQQECSKLRPRTKDTGENFLQKKGFQKFFLGDLENFNNSRTSAVLEPRTGQFSRT